MSCSRRDASRDMYSEDICPVMPLNSSLVSACSFESPFMVNVKNSTASSSITQTIASMAYSIFFPRDRFLNIAGSPSASIILQSGLLL